MFELFIYEKDVDKFKDKLTVNFIDNNLLKIFNSFLYYSAKYLLVHTDSKFKEYIPIIVVKHNLDGKILAISELMYNIDKNITEIYNVCVLPLERKKNHCTDLIHFISDIIQSKLQCDLWIAVSYINPMYDIVVEIYKNLGFTDLIQTNIETPSNIFYSNGFLELYKFEK